VKVKFETAFNEIDNLTDPSKIPVAIIIVYAAAMLMGMPWGNH